MATLWRRALVFIVLCSLLFVVVISLRVAIADYYYERSRRAFESIDFSNFDYARELESYFSDINRSLSWRAKNADALDFKANLLYQSWVLSPDGQYLQESDLLQEAVQLHNEALKYRSGWAFSAARLALIYSHQAQLDTHFNAWFTEAHRLGLYETSIAKSLMLMGLENWQKLTQLQRQRVLEFVQVSIEQKSNSADKIKLILKHYNKWQKVCRSLHVSQRMMNVCEDAIQ